MLNFRKCLNLVFIFCQQINYIRKRKRDSLRIFQLVLTSSLGISASGYADADIPREDVQKYILATSDFAKSIQTDINHYVTRDWINDASFRQRLDSISKNILRRQNPLELVLEDISTFDAQNPLVGSLLREIDIKKKQSDSDFIELLPSHPGN